MKYIFFGALLLLVVSGIAWSQPEPDDDQAEPKKEVQPAQPAKKAEGKTQKPGEQERPTPFVPSEQVGADSVISLPTDI